jgi:hypothetical protein
VAPGLVGRWVQDGHTLSSELLVAQIDFGRRDKKSKLHTG